MLAGSGLPACLPGDTISGVCLIIAALALFMLVFEKITSNNAGADCRLAVEFLYLNANL